MHPYGVPVTWHAFSHWVTSPRAGTVHEHCDHPQTFTAVPPPPRPAPALLRPFTQEEPGQGMESAAALGRSPQWSAPPERQRAQSRLQAEPAPQRAADLQAGLAAPLAIRTQYFQFTHPAVDLRRPHSACTQDCQVPGHPAWSPVDEKA